MKKLFPDSATARQRKQAGNGVPRVEALEDRMLPSTVTVTNPNDDGSAGSLRAAIQQADESGGAVTIKLVSGETYHLNNGRTALGDLPVQGLGQTALNLTITTTGSGMATIDANFTSRFFEVFGDHAGATLNLTNIHLNRGEEIGANGGGVLVDSRGTLNLQQCSITNCIDKGDIQNGDAQGGAVFNDGSASLENSKIQNNQALGHNGSPGGHTGGNAFGGGVYNQGSLDIVNGMFSGNLAEGGTSSSSDSSHVQGGCGFGGGLYDQGTSLSITGTTFSSNLASGGKATLAGGEGRAMGGSAYGGGALLSGGEGPGSISNATFQNNQADGGAGSVSDGAAGYGGQAQGGAIANFGDVQITKTQIRNNSATGGSSQFGAAACGGGIANGGSLEISDATLSGNTAMGGASSDSFSVSGGGGFGGAIASPSATPPHIPHDGSFLMVTGTTLSNNVAVGGNAVLTGGEGAATGGVGEGGGLFWAAGAEGLLVNDTFAFNTAFGGRGTVAHSSGYGGSGYGGGAEGGAISVASPRHGDGLELAFDTVAYNHATAGKGTTGSGFAEAGGIASFNGGDAPVEMENVLVAKNTATSMDNDVVGNFHSFGHNLIGDDSGSTGFDTGKGDILGGGMAPVVNPALDTQLRNNGGPTQTIALLPGSVAIDHGDNSFDGPDSGVDQRGVARPQQAGGIVDIGAYEFVKTRVSLSEAYQVHWNATAADNNFITGNLLTPLVKAGILSAASLAEATVSVASPPAGLTVNPDGSFTYKPPLGFFSVAPPLSFQFSVDIDGQNLGDLFSVFITVYRGLRLSQQT